MPVHAVPLRLAFLPPFPSHMYVKGIPDFLHVLPYSDEQLVSFTIPGETPAEHLAAVRELEEVETVKSNSTAVEAMEATITKARKDVDANVVAKEVHI